MADNAKTCFVVMRSGVKTDLVTRRSLDLDKSYRALTRPAVVDAGGRCVRADDIVHSGTIDTTMYRHLRPGGSSAHRPRPVSATQAAISDQIQTWPMTNLAAASGTLGSVTAMCGRGSGQRG